MFISYSSADRKTAERICSRLEEADLACWMAPRDIAPGADWGEAILRAIEGCEVMVLVLSAQANGSQQVRREVERAVHHARAIVPFRIERVDPSGSLEYYLSTQHWLDAFDPPLERNIDRLVQTVHSLVAQTDDAGGGGQAPPRSRPWRRRRGGRLVALSAAGLLAILAALAAWLFRPDAPPPPRVELHPALGASEVPVDLHAVTVQFSEPMVRTTMEVSALPAGQLPPLAETDAIQWASPRKLEVFLGRLEPSRRYAFRLSPAGGQLRTEQGRAVGAIDVRFETVFDIDAFTRIDPDATWQEVLGKARAMRQLGYQAEAIELFAKYGDLFSRTDPTARTFSEIAQQFTRQAERLGVAGGMYIYEVVPDSPAAKAGLRAGDILVGLGPEAVTEQKELDAARRKYLPDAEVEVTYLRGDASGELSVQTTRLSNGPMGLRMMPI